MDAAAGSGGRAAPAGAGGKSAAYGGDAGLDAGEHLAAANGDDAGGNSEDAAASRLLLEGVAQKGPFIRGTSIVVSELDKALAQTGRTFTSQIDDDSGRFSVSVTALSGPYVRLSATGFNYNEVTGATSQPPNRA